LLKLALDKKLRHFLDQVVHLEPLQKQCYDKDFSDSIYGIEKMDVM
jgi:hypothetical protein